jgi:hypothetical protein
MTKSNLLAALAAAILAVGQWMDGYSDWWWFDNAMHFTGGVAAGSAIVGRDSSIVQDMAVVFCIATIWELIEYHKGIKPWDGMSNRAAAEDTLLDTLLVMMGAYWAARAEHRRRKHDYGRLAR